MEPINPIAVGITLFVVALIAGFGIGVACGYFVARRERDALAAFLRGAQDDAREEGGDD